MRLQRPRDRIHPLARTLKRRVSDASTVSLVLVQQPLRATNSDDLAGFREVACSPKDSIALCIGGAASSFVDEVYTGGATSSSFVHEVTKVDSPATLPSTWYNTLAAERRHLLDGSGIEASMRRGPSAFALAAFPDEEEFESEIPICMLPCVSSLVLRKPASISSSLTVASTRSSTVSADCKGDSDGAPKTSKPRDVHHGAASRVRQLPARQKAVVHHLEQIAKCR